MNYWTQSEKNIYVAAHQGWCEKYPGNTVEAFRAAADLGVDQIETDIRETKDGELICIHNETVDDYSDCTGNVHDMTLEEIKKIDIGAYKGEEFKNCKIPTFIEFMDIVKDYPMITIDVELKEYPTEGNEERAYRVCDKVLKIIEEYGFNDRCVINSFSPKLHEYILEKYGHKYKHHVFFPHERCMTNVSENPINPYSYAYCACMFGPEKGVRAEKEHYDFIRSTNTRPWAGASVCDAESLDHVIKCGAELITCNNPDVILELLRERGLHK